MNNQTQEELLNAEKALKQELKSYSKLEKINKSEEFNDFFELQIDTVAQKMLQCFTGEGPKNYDEFCRIRGEVIAYLYPIQQIRGAKILKQQLMKQLNEYYNTEPR